MSLLIKNMRTANHDSSSTIKDDDEAFKGLLDAFGSIFSIQEIASAYCKGKQDLNRAGEILYQLLENKSNGSTIAHDGAQSTMDSSTLLHDDIMGPKHPSGDSKPSKTKKTTASMGTVSGVLGKTYMRTLPSRNDTGAKKPLKIIMGQTLPEFQQEPPTSAFEPCKESPCSSGIEEFLFQMLGEGFKLNMTAIHEVLGQCGYDAKKTVEVLVASLEDATDKDEEINMESSGKYLEVESGCLEENHAAYTRTANTSSQHEKDKPNLSKEIMEALFTGPKTCSDEPEKKKLIWGSNRTRVVGKVPVKEPFKDIFRPLCVESLMRRPAFSHDTNNDYVEDGQLHVLRLAKKQHMEMMKTYYEAAIDAFANGEHARADYLLKQGQLYHKFAVEVNDKCAGEIVPERDENDNEQAVPLDLGESSSKGALRLLRFHLCQLAGISTVKYLKVILGNGRGDKKDQKRQQAVINLLKELSINWTEEQGNPYVIIIRLDLLEPSKLQFDKDSL